MPVRDRGLSLGPCHSLNHSVDYFLFGASARNARDQVHCARDAPVFLPKDFTIINTQGGCRGNTSQRSGI